MCEIFSFFFSRRLTFLLFLICWALPQYGVFILWHYQELYRYYCIFALFSAKKPLNIFFLEMTYFLHFCFGCAPHGWGLWKYYIVFYCLIKHYLSWCSFVSPTLLKILLKGFFRNIIYWLHFDWNHEKFVPIFFFFRKTKAHSFSE